MPCGSTTAFFGVMMIFAFMRAQKDFAEKFRAARVIFETLKFLAHCAIVAT
jgi:hypothetical protein